MIVQFVWYAWNKKVLLHTLVPDLGLFEPPHHYIQDLSSRFLAKSEFFGFNGLHTWYQGYPRVPNLLRPQVHGFLWISYPLNTVCHAHRGHCVLLLSLGKDLVQQDLSVQRRQHRAALCERLLGGHTTDTVSTSQLEPTLMRKEKNVKKSNSSKQDTRLGNVIFEDSKELNPFDTMLGGK